MFQWRCYQDPDSNKQCKLKSKLDPSRKVLAVQDFCHFSQGRNEIVGDFICHLKQNLSQVYGYDKFVKRLTTPLYCKRA